MRNNNNTTLNKRELATLRKLLKAGRKDQRYMHKLQRLSVPDYYKSKVKGCSEDFSLFVMNEMFKGKYEDLDNDFDMFLCKILDEDFYQCLVRYKDVLIDSRLKTILPLSEVDNHYNLVYVGDKTGLWIRPEDYL